MNLGDLLVKIATNRNLSQQEIDFLRLEGNNTQQRNSFVAGNTTPGNQLNVAFPFAPIYNEVLAVDTASLLIVIPGGFKHLMFMGAGRSSKAATFDAMSMTINGDTGANYIGNVVVESGASTVTGVGAVAQSAMAIGALSAASANAAAGSSFFVFLAHYRSSLWKSVVTMATVPNYDGTYGAIGMWGGTWQSTAPIEKLSVVAAGGNLVAGSLFSVYGIL